LLRPEPSFSQDALRQLRRLAVWRQRRLIDAIRIQLMEQDAATVTRNKFRLRRASAYADYELRVDDLRAFYRIDEKRQAIVTIIGRKHGNRLIVEGKEFKL
jgi:hypothetical protein